MPIFFDIVDRMYIICRSFVWNSNHPQVYIRVTPKMRVVSVWVTWGAGINLHSLKLFGISNQTENLFGFDGFIISTSLGLDTWTWTTKHSYYPTIKRVLQIRDKLLATADTPSLAATILILGLARALWVPIKHISTSVLVDWWMVSLSCLDTLSITKACFFHLSWIKDITSVAHDWIAWITYSRSVSSVICSGFGFKIGCAWVILWQTFESLSSGSRNLFEGLRGSLRQECWVSRLPSTIFRLPEMWRCWKEHMLILMYFFKIKCMYIYISKRLNGDMIVF